MWFKNAIRKILDTVNTRYVGKGGFTTAERVGKKIYLIPNGRERKMDPGKIVMWEVRQIRNSKYFPALKKEEMFEDGKIFPIFSSPMYKSVNGNSDAWLLMEIYRGVDGEFVSLRAETDAFMQIINDEPGLNNMESEYFYSAQLPKGLKNALRLIYNHMRSKEKEIGGQFFWDFEMFNLATTDKNQLILLDPIGWGDI